MDGLALSAVPVEKAGMAAGLFNTVRVAGEGIALAMVSAFLTRMNDVNLSKSVQGLTSAEIHKAAAWLGGGNLQQALILLPGVSRAVVQNSYDSAYLCLFRVLAAITLCCALAILALSGQPRRENTFSEESE